MFILGKSYTKKDIYRILKVPEERQRGAWDKGYHMYDDNMFIFSNVGIPGRTGHDYNNYWDGDLFVWEAKDTSHIHQPQIQMMLNPSPHQKILLFTRTRGRDPFTFEGNVIVKEYFDTTPVKIIWKFEHYPYETLEEPTVPYEKQNRVFKEGELQRVYVNKYERNPLARRMCIEHYGAYCNVCNFDFEITYGELGKGYIHIHHIIPISTIGQSYILIPEKDLIPVCPNCHSMIHKKSPPINIADLKIVIKQNRK